MFSFIEDIPVDAFTTGIPWTWEDYGDWSRALTAHGTAVHVAALVGHSNLRVYVMGEEAWDRAAVDDERAGARECSATRHRRRRFGMSTSFIDVDCHGRAARRAADGAELAVGGGAGERARRSGPSLEFLLWIKEPERWRANIDQVARLCGLLGVRRARGTSSTEQP
ncbi:MAG: hypothetical protein U0W40_19940 [Acidimicrobiia bacterium]